MSSNAGMNIQHFIKDYCERHKHPVNAMLHICGVPMAFVGFYWLVVGKTFLGLLLLFFGYLLQYIGHKVQGNEVGEVTLIKALYRAITKRKGSYDG